jgi:hypothetical protein
MKTQLRTITRCAHLWLGLTGGVFICLMGFTGGVAGLHPQITTLLSPAVPEVPACQSSPDWNVAARDIASYAHSEIYRIYGPYGSDSRYRFRMTTDCLFRRSISTSSTTRVPVAFRVPSISHGWTGQSICATSFLRERVVGYGPGSLVSRCSSAVSAACSCGCSQSPVSALCLGAFSGLVPLGLDRPLIEKDGAHGKVGFTLEWALEPRTSDSPLPSAPVVPSLSKLCGTGLV